MIPNKMKKRAVQFIEKDETTTGWVRVRRQDIEGYLSSTRDPMTMSMQVLSEGDEVHLFDLPAGCRSTKILPKVSNSGIVEQDLYVEYSTSKPTPMWGGIVYERDGSLYYCKGAPNAQQDA